MWSGVCRFWLVLGRFLQALFGFGTYHGSPMFSYGFIWFSYGFPRAPRMVFIEYTLWFSYCLFNCFPMAPLWCSESTQIPPNPSFWGGVWGVSWGVFWERPFYFLDFAPHFLLCYAIVSWGRKSGFQGFRPDSSRDSNNICPPAARGGTSVKQTSLWEKHNSEDIMNQS